MKISNKRTCEGCRALTYAQSISGNYGLQGCLYKCPHCRWGYKNTASDGLTYPLEPCPKPKTYKDWSEGFFEFDKNKCEVK
jgi:hypothetical protein